MLNSDSVSCFTKFQEKISDAILPTGFMIVKSVCENIVTFLYLTDMTSNLSLQASVLIKYNLSFEIFLKGIPPLPITRMRHLLSANDKLTSINRNFKYYILC